MARTRRRSDPIAVTGSELVSVALVLGALLVLFMFLIGAFG